MFRVLAVEQPQAVVLNYAPGPLDTPMVKDLLEDQRTDPGNITEKMGSEVQISNYHVSVVRAMFEDLKRTGALLKPEDSAAAMVALLRKRNFQSGDHVDFYDDKVKEALGGGAVPSSQPSASSTLTVASNKIE